MLEYNTYCIDNKKQKLVIFLHGYNGTVDDHQYAVDWLRQHLHNTLLVVPHAPEISDKNPQKFQWFGLLQYDPDNRRSLPETSAEEIFAVYNRAGVDMQRCAEMINAFIDDLQHQYGIDDAHTFLCGFSQGAMLTIYTALTRRSKLGGAFAFSGLVAGADTLSYAINSRPPLHLFHGSDDMKVQFKTLPFTTRWLAAHQIPIAINTYDGLAHRMNEDEIKIAASIINQTL